MKSYFNNWGVKRAVLGLFSIAILVGCMQSCKKNLGLSYQVQDRQMLMFDMLKQDTSMTFAVAALEKAKKLIYDSANNRMDTLKLSTALDSYGPYTFFAPNNDAFRKFFAVQGKKGLDDFTDSAIYAIMNYHILPTSLKAEDFIQGPQATSTGAGDYISIDISQGYKNTAVVNGVATVYQTDIEFSNGYEHKIDAVLSPPTLTIGQFLLNNPDKYSILTSGLQKAGLMDTLTNLTDSIGRRIRLTLFAETNDVLKNAGIENYDNLPHDTLVKLMRNHIITGQNAVSSYTHHTAAMPSYNIIDRWDSTIVTLDGDDYFYFDLAGVHLIDGNSDFTSSDVAMRNGIINNVSKPISFPANKPRTQIFYDFWSGTNYAYGIPSISDGNSNPPMNGSSGNYRYYYDGSIANNLLFVNPDATNDSMVALIKGVRKGKYQFTINYKASYNRDIFELRYQNDSIGLVDFRSGTTYTQNTVMGTYDFKTSGDKRLNFVCLKHNGGGMNLDCLILTPVYDNP